MKSMKWGSAMGFEGLKKAVAVCVVAPALWSAGPQISGVSTLESSYLSHDNALVDPTSDGDLLLAPGFNPRLKQVLSGRSGGLNWSFLLEASYNKQIDSLIRETWLTDADKNYRTTDLEKVERVIENLSLSLESPLWRMTVGDAVPGMSPLSYAGRKVRGVHLGAEQKTWKFEGWGGESEFRRMSLTETETNDALQSTNDLDQNGFLTQNPLPVYRRLAAGGQFLFRPVDAWSGSITALYEEDLTNNIFSNEVTVLSPVSRMLLGTVQTLKLGGFTLETEDTFVKAETNRFSSAASDWAFGTRNVLAFESGPFRTRLGATWYQPTFSPGGVQTFSEGDRVEGNWDGDFDFASGWTPGLSYRMSAQSVSSGFIQSNIEHEARARIGYRAPNDAEWNTEITGRIRQNEWDAEFSSTARAIDLKFTKLSPGILGRWYDRSVSPSNALWSVEGRLETRNRGEGDRWLLFTTHRVSYKQTPLTLATTLEWGSTLTSEWKVVPQKFEIDLSASTTYEHSEKTGTNLVSDSWRVFGQLTAIWNITEILSLSAQYKPVWVQTTADGLIDNRTRFLAHTAMASVTMLY